MKQYILGFIISILLTLTAYVLVVNNLLSGFSLTLVIVALALIQLWVQLVFFLHLDHEKAPRWNLSVLLSSIGMILLLVIGTLVIMNNLNYQHMSGSEADDYLLHDEGIHK